MVFFTLAFASSAHAQEVDTITTRTLVPRPKAAPATRAYSDSAYRKQLVSMLAEMHRDQQSDRTVRVVTMFAAAATALGVWILVLRGSDSKDKEMHWPRDEVDDSKVRP